MFCRWVSDGKGSVISDSLKVLTTALSSGHTNRQRKAITDTLTTFNKCETEMNIK